jgi:S1-C subfamily serine protease
MKTALASAAVMAPFPPVLGDSRMFRHWSRGLVLGLAVVVVAVGRADDPAVSQARVLKDLTYLTSDECEGRSVGSKGIQLAADHIAREFARAGLKPGGDRGTYFQNFQAVGYSRVEKPPTLFLTGPLGQTIKLDADKNFSVQRPSGSGKAEAPVVFAGYGLTLPKHGYDDYAGLDVAGKVVVVLRRSPRFGNAAADRFGASDRTVDGYEFRDDAKAANAAAHKAAAVLFVNAADVLAEAPPPAAGVGRGGRGGRGGFGGQRGDTLTPSPSPRGRGGETGPLVSSTEVVDIPVAQIKRALVDDLLRAAGDELASVEKDIDATLRPHSEPLKGWTCRIETAMQHKLVPVKNVVGVLEGSGPYADETIVIGAHYDHMGYGVSFGGFGGGSTFGGVGAFGSPSVREAARMVHHGADDNASGTVSVLELARRFASHPQRQGRRLVFIAFTAEESGLIGSAYYARHPAFPLEKTVAMVNFDMVGRLQDDRLEVTGVGTARGLEAMVDRLAAKHKFRLTKVQTGFGPSDHQSFTLHGVPALEFFTGFHEQYHMPSDRVETINVAGVVRVVDLVQDLVTDLGTQSQRLEYVKVTTPYPRTSALWSRTASFGVVPHATDHKGGVLVETVFENTPAARAGLKKGDRIVAVGGEPAEDLPSYLRTVRKLPPGEKIEVFAVRGDRPVKFTVELTRLNTTMAATAFGITPDGAVKDALRVIQVTANSTAAKAGLKAGDRIVEIAGKPTTDGVEAMRHLLGFDAGEQVELAFERDGKVQKAKVALAFEPTTMLGLPSFGARSAGGGALAALGVMPNFDGGDGILIARVRDSSAAAKAGFKVNDRLVEIAGKQVQGMQAVASALGQLKPGDTVEMTVRRDGKSETVKVKIESSP